MQGRYNSSHVRTSSAEISASKLRFPMVKDAPSRHTLRNHFIRGTAKPIKSNSSSMADTVPVSVSGFSPFVSTVTFKTVLDFFHIRNLSNASFEEAIFLHLLYGHLATEARMLAAILPYSVQRPLRALLAAMNEPGKSYTKRSAKTRPLSCSPASLKKRLSGA